VQLNIMKLRALRGASAMTTIERAVSIAAAAHAGQIDKAGEPYLLHPLRVMLGVRTPEERMAAVLHDAVEDTGVTLADLIGAGFPGAVIDAVDALTKRPGETRMNAARRARANPIARTVKIADVMDNMDLKRITAPTDEDYARLREYEAVLQLLGKD
jgi:GTP diphosphokinase / guanosine-3',5'-bis(diphosphate) 3'-diphosphatase